MLFKLTLQAKSMAVYVHVKLKVFVIIIVGLIVSDGISKMSECPAAVYVE